MRSQFPEVITPSLESGRRPQGSPRSPEVAFDPADASMLLDLRSGAQSSSFASNFGDQLPFSKLDAPEEAVVLMPLTWSW